MDISLKNNNLTEGKIWKVMLKFVLPIFLGTLFQSLYTTIDAIIIGRFAGKDAFAAIESVLNFQRLPITFLLDFHQEQLSLFHNILVPKERKIYQRLAILQYYLQ